jgi:aldose 1-epimerase
MPEMITREAFGHTEAGETVAAFTLANAQGMRVRFLSYGGIIQRIEVPDRSGRLGNVVLGFDTLAEYEAKNGNIHFGALIGRYANRIGGAGFTLDGYRYALPANDGPNTLHGGADGFGRRVWAVSPGEENSAVLRLTSPDGDAGFPGRLEVTVTYRLSDDNVLSLDYAATTDRDTVLNLTNHSYFNLAGDGAGGVDGHLLRLAASRVTVAGAGMIPTGEIAAVEGTPLDFRAPMPIGARLRSAHPQMLLARGYDHNFILDRRGDGLEFAASVHEPTTGRVLECFTTEPAVQVYTANFLDGTVAGSSGGAYRQGDAFTLETQHFPDSPNHPSFPSTVLRAGATFKSRTTFHFSVEK